MATESGTEFRFGIDIYVASDDEDISVQHLRVRRIENLEKCRKLKKLSIIASCVDEIKGLDANTQLEELELYQGLIREIRNISHLTALRVLDLSFNNIKRIENIESLVYLEKLYLSNNKISVIEGLENLRNLRVLELGSNKIRSLDAPCLQPLEQLEELWLGKNRIEDVGGDAFSQFHFPNLKQVSLQSNRLTEWNYLLFSQVAPNIENAYFGSNKLPDMTLEVLQAVNVNTMIELDISCNCLTQVPQFPRPLVRLEEIWLNDNQITTTESLTCLGRLFPNLRTIYIERNPVHKECPLDCRMTIMRSAPETLEQIDASRIPEHELRVIAESTAPGTVKPILKH